MSEGYFSGMHMRLCATLWNCIWFRKAHKVPFTEGEVCLYPILSLHKNKRADRLVNPLVILGGAEGDRTPDPKTARGDKRWSNEALYHSARSYDIQHFRGIYLGYVAIDEKILS